MSTPGDPPTPTDDAATPRVPVIASPRARRNIVIVTLVLIVALIVHGATGGPPKSTYPVFTDAVGYGTFTSFTSQDLIFFMDCARSSPDNLPIASGFYQVPGEGLTYHEYQMNPHTHVATTVTISESEFIANSRHTQFRGYVYLTPTTRLVTNAPGPNLCG